MVTVRVALGNEFPRESRANIPENILLCASGNEFYAPMLNEEVEVSMKSKLSPILFMLALAGRAEAGWQEEMDLLTAGAAASVVAMHSCNGEVFSNNANQFAATRLRREAQKMESPNEAYEYATLAFESKVNAMWQSSEGLCSKSSRLVDMARSTGFLAPSNN